MKLANRWNIVRYSIYTPVYDLVAGLFGPMRKKSIAQLDLHAGEKVLLIGAGTGLDLKYLPQNVQITATDITPAMLQLLKFRSRKNAKVAVHCMDGQKLDFPSAHFDAVILHLILAVIPDPIACIQEAERVLKPNGKIVVMDKFLATAQKPSTIRKILGKITDLLFSDINRKSAAIFEATKLELIHDKAAALAGTFRYILLKKPS